MPKNDGFYPSINHYPCKHWESNQTICRAILCLISSDISELIKPWCTRNIPAICAAINCSIQ